MMKMAGRLFISGSWRRRHSPAVWVSIRSSGAVRSTATVTRVWSPSVYTNCSNSFTLRYGASMKSCDCPSDSARRSKKRMARVRSGGFTGR